MLGYATAVCFFYGPSVQTTRSGFLQGSSVVPIGCAVDGGHLCFRNFNSIISIDVVRVKSYGNCFVNPKGVPMWIAANKLNL